MAPPNTSIHDPIRGLILVILSMACFSLSDAAAKLLNHSLPPLEIAWLRYFVFTVLLMPSLVSSNGNILKTTRPGLQILRGFGMLGSAIFFIMAIRSLPLADATATGFVSPLFITALSIIFLREQVGLRRWAAVIIGLIGVLIVVRPGGTSFQLASLLPVLSAMSWAIAIIITRRMSGNEGMPTVLAYSALTGLVALSIIAPFSAIIPSWSDLGIGLFIGLISTLAQWLIIEAYRHGDASLLAPFSYCQLVWSSLLGLLFGDFPDHWTIIGASIIIASGLYTAQRERIKSRPSKHVATAAQP